MPKKYNLDDEFQPIEITLDGETYQIVPSVEKIKAIQDAAGDIPDSEDELAKMGAEPLAKMAAVLIGAEDHTLFLKSDVRKIARLISIIGDDMKAIAEMDVPAKS